MAVALNCWQKNDTISPKNSSGMFENIADAYMNTKYTSLDIYIYIPKYDCSEMIQPRLNIVLRLISFNLGFDIFINS